MAKLSGQDAFDRVLGALVREGHLRHDADLARERAEARANSVVLELSQRKSLDSAAAENAFLDLYGAVEGCIRKLDELGENQHARDLLEKLSAAKKHIDPIPF